MIRKNKRVISALLLMIVGIAGVTLLPKDAPVSRAQDAVVIEAAKGRILWARSAGIADKTGRVTLADLLNHGFNPNARDWQRESSLRIHPASGLDPLASVRNWWFRRKIQASAYDTALIVATHAGPPHAVKTLLAHGAQVNATGTLGRTALHYAAQKGSVEKVRLLLTAGADVTARSAFGETPLGSALAKDHTPVVTLLRAAGARQ